MSVSHREKAIKAAARDLMKRGHRVYRVLNKEMIKKGCDLYYESGCLDDKGTLLMVESDQVNQERLKEFRNYDGLPHGKEMVVRIFGDNLYDPGRFIPFRFDAERVISVDGYDLYQILSRAKKEKPSRKKDKVTLPNPRPRAVKSRG